jgi:hypothetical protein
MAGWSSQGRQDDGQDQATQTDLYVTSDNVYRPTRIQEIPSMFLLRGLPVATDGPTRLHIRDLKR